MHCHLSKYIDRNNLIIYPFQGIDEGNIATDFHSMGFKIQAKDQAWYFFTLVVEPASIQAFIEGTMSQSESGEKQCHIT